MTPEEREFDRCMSAMPGRPSARQLLYQTHHRVVTAAVKAAEERGRDAGRADQTMLHEIRVLEQELFGTQTRKAEERMRERCAGEAPSLLVADARMRQAEEAAWNSAIEHYRQAILALPLTGDSDGE